jgi:hypothetical protein
MLAWVGDYGGSGIGNERDVFATLESIDDC